MAPNLEISLSDPKRVIQVYPSELRFPFLPNTMLSASSSIKLINPTDNYVGGQIWHRKELSVVLYPVDQQESPDGMPHTKELIQVNPHWLRFPFVPDASNSVKSLIKVVNNTDDYIAFLGRYTSTNVAEYTMRPSNGILPPRCTQNLVVMRTTKEGLLRSTECNDMVFLFSTIVSEDFQTNDLPEFYETKAGVIWHKVELRVHLEVGAQLQPTDFMPDTEVRSTDDHMALQYFKHITNNFFTERIIGRGGFGVVYKGVLGNGKMVAVKKLVQSMSSSQEQFENEVNLLMKVKHPNIVQLVGYCYETQHLRNHHEGKFIFAGSTECLLSLEFLPKGSLDKYISDASTGLDWPTRLKIIEGISYGLQYLHEQSDGPIIHLDLKPGNILLDENMIPKITDFGLSRLFDQKQTFHTVLISGTLGYMPPEYLRGTITPMSYIFGLGVIIMEVITGHRDYPYDIKTSSSEFIELELQKWRNVMQKESGYTSLEINCQQITRCIQVGLICVNPERTKRPTMKKIIDLLQGLESMDWYISNEVTSLAYGVLKCQGFLCSRERASPADADAGAKPPPPPLPPCPPCLLLACSAPRDRAVQGASPLLGSASRGECPPPSGLRPLPELPRRAAEGRWVELAARLLICSGAPVPLESSKIACAGLNLNDAFCNRR
ncbi:probable L-type lectin-domain containing receptor kinase V.3 [Triticum dicoccoides]|uniref:probable L-type lectin-domain containing receptor kinase V.3 n=1 Tax=Triticum dicoccoides TaxID=85692 RepID=UPI0018908106|nr:probable L-type lectin-domain containing receptor kinase V.3 [Triticum dicoccoides]